MRWWWRDSSHTCLTLPVSCSSRWSMRNASRSCGARRPVTGSRNQSGSGDVRRVASRAPTSCRPGARRRRRSLPGARRRAPRSRVPAGSGVGNSAAVAQAVGQPGGSPRDAPGGEPRRPVEPGPPPARATSVGGHPRSRWTYQPQLAGSQRHPLTGQEALLHGEGRPGRRDQGPGVDRHRRRRCARPRRTRPAGRAGPCPARRGHA